MDLLSLSGRPLRDIPSNYCINATVRLVTPLAVASVAPSRPARYALRWTDRSTLPERPVTSSGVPERTNHHGVLSEGVVEVRRRAAEVEATQSCYSRLGIQGPSPWHPREKANCLLDLVYQGFQGAVIVDPPRLGSAQLTACDVSEKDRARFHFNRSSRRTSLASVVRPASTSAPEATRARCSAARSSSSSQSPGSMGRSSISVPSGRSVGSSTTKRPFRTRAFNVMVKKVPTNGAVDNRRYAGRTNGPSNKRVNLTIRPVTHVACATRAPGRLAGYAQR